MIAAAVVRQPYNPTGQFRPTALGLLGQMKNNSANIFIFKH